MSEIGSSPPVPPSNAPVVLRIILAVIMALPALAGTLTIWGMGMVFASEGFYFHSGDASIMLAIIIVSAAVATPAYIVLALILRFARWKRAPVASLVLAIIFALSAILATAMAQYTVVSTEEYWTLVIGALLATLAGSGLPLTHWWASMPHQAP